MTTVSATAGTEPTTTSTPRTVPIRFAAGALATSAGALAGLLVAKPWGERLNSSSDDFLHYDELLRVRDAAWTGMIADGLAFAVVGLTLGLGMLHLVRGRGHGAALVGAVLTSLGGILFAMGAGAFATFVWFATAPGLSDGAGPSLVDYANAHVGRLLVADMAGFVCYTLGTVVLCGAATRAKVVPAPAVVAFLVLTVLMFTPLPAHVLDAVQIAQMVALVGFAVLVWRRA